VLALRGELESKARALQALQGDMKGLQVSQAADGACGPWKSITHCS